MPRLRGRPSAQKLWSQLRIRDHWRIPVEETQRAIDLSEELTSTALFANGTSGKDVDVIAVMAACAETINRDLGAQQICINSDQPQIVVSADPIAMKDIMARLMEPMSQWAAPGSTMQVNVRNETQDDDSTAVGIHSNCEIANHKERCRTACSSRRAAHRAETRQRLFEGIACDRPYRRHGKLTADGEWLQADPRHAPDARQTRRQEDQCAPEAMASGFERRIRKVGAWHSRSCGVSEIACSADPRVSEAPTPL